VQKAENALRKASRKLARAERELERTEVGLGKCQHDFDSAMKTKKVFTSSECSQATKKPVPRHTKRITTLFSNDVMTPIR
jgi:ribosomal protein L44E